MKIRVSFTCEFFFLSPDLTFVPPRQANHKEIVFEGGMIACPAVPRVGEIIPLHECVPDLLDTPLKVVRVSHELKDGVLHPKIHCKTYKRTVDDNRVKPTEAGFLQWVDQIFKPGIKKLWLKTD